jgi:growth factor-regulated tyrosine kinase substrate
MSWFAGGVAIDERVEKATSESLPSGEQDLALNLEICDLIRSKTVPAKDAMRSLKRRLLHSNPNVQILTLHLTDLCIKNGGAHFLVEVASREFMDSFVLVLKPLNGAVNSDVKQLMLEYLQNWAHAFEGQMQLGYVNKVYSQLKDEGELLFCFYREFQAYTYSRV